MFCCCIHDRRFCGNELDTLPKKLLRENEKENGLRFFTRVALTIFLEVPIDINVMLKDAHLSQSAFQKARRKHLLFILILRVGSDMETAPALKNKYVKKAKIIE